MFVKFEVPRLKFVYLFQVFQYPKPLDKHTIKELKKEWAKYFLKVRSRS